MLSNLKWSDTDNFYMNLGCHKVTLASSVPCLALTFHLLPLSPPTPQGVGLVVCGDDKGSLWLYNIPTMVQVSNHFKSTHVALQFALCAPCRVLTLTSTPPLPPPLPHLHLPPPQ